MIEDNSTANAETSFEPLHFDVEDYLSHVEGLELSDEEARQFLGTLWNIMVAFVDLWFDLSVGEGPAGQIVKAAIALEAESRGLLDSVDQFREHENQKSGGAAIATLQTGEEDS